MTVTNNIYQKHKISRIQCGYKFRIDRTCSSICNTTCVSDFHLKSKHIIQKCLADMGTGITDVVGGPQNFLPPRSDEFQKLCNREGGQGVRLSILPPLFSFLPPLFSFLTPCITFLLSLFFSPPLLLSPAPSLLSPGLPIHCPSSHNRRTDRTKKNNIQAELQISCVFAFFML